MKKFLLLITAVLLLLTFVGCNEKADTAADGSAEKKVEAAVEHGTKGGLDAKEFPIRDEANPIITIVTDFGNMTVEMYRDVAPAHVDSFLARAKDGFYNGLIFHRVIKNFMIQGGDPTGTGTGNAGYYLNAEFNKVIHQDGTLSMARAQSPNSASCQFFICLARNQSTQYLDGKYTAFGQVISGYDVLHKIGDVEVVGSPSGEVSKPGEDVYMRKVFVSDIEGNEL